MLASGAVDPQTFDVSEASAQYWRSGHRRRVLMACGCLPPIFSGGLAWYFWWTLPFGDPESSERYLVLELQWAGALLFAVSFTGLIFLWLAPRVIFRVALSQDDLAVYVRHPRTRYDFPFPITRKWGRLVYPIRITDYSRSRDPALTAIPYVMKLGSLSRRQSGGLDRQAFDGILGQARAAGLKTTVATEGDRTITTILPPGPFPRYPS
jgi:hypothetical protein